jgi:hypothetical protein
VAEPSRKTNPELVRDCVVWLLERISHDRGDYVDGCVIRKHSDPRQVSAEAETDAFKTKFRLLSVRMADEALQGQASFKGNKRQAARIEILGVISQTEEMDERGLTLDDVRARVAHSVRWNLNGDQQLAESAAALGIDPKPSCIGLEVDRVVPLVRKHPLQSFVIQVSYQYEERGTPA